MITVFAAVVQVRKDRKFQCIYACPCQRLFTIEPPAGFSDGFVLQKHVCCSEPILCGTGGYDSSGFVLPRPVRKAAQRFSAFQVLKRPPEYWRSFA